MNFGDKVKQLRAERNLTQPQLAQAIGIEQSYLSKLENDKSVPSADIFQAILRAFSVDVATFLEGVDDKVVHRDLKQVPEVANHLSASVARKVHSIKAWLFSSAIACVLGLTMALAGYRSLIFTNKQYNYISDGVLLPGEPTDYFEKQMDFLNRGRAEDLIEGHAFLAKTEEFNRRINQDMRLLDEYRGEAFVEKTDGGQRLYNLAKISYIDAPQNRWLMLIGAFFSFSGLLGFIVEQRLRSVKL